MEEHSLSRSLHTLTARLDRAADQVLRAEAGLSYPRFLALFMIGLEGAHTQRALADRLGVTEPSVSRMTRVLAQAGLLETTAAPAGGNRRGLRLTPAGQELVERWGRELERRFAALVVASDVPYDLFAEHAMRVLDTLEAGDSPTAPRPPGSMSSTSASS